MDELNLPANQASSAVMLARIDERLLAVLRDISSLRQDHQRAAELAKAALEKHETSNDALFSQIQTKLETIPVLESLGITVRDGFLEVDKHLVLQDKDIEALSKWRYFISGAFAVIIGLAGWAVVFFSGTSQHLVK